MGKRKDFLPIAGIQPGTCGLAALDLNNWAMVLLHLYTIYIGYIFLHIK